MKVVHATGLLTVLIVLIAQKTSESAKLPNTFKQCKRSDSNPEECMKSAAEQALKAMKDGIPSLQMLPIDPMTVSRIVIEQGAGRPVNVNLQLFDAKLYGLSNTKVSSFKPDFEKRIYNGEVLVDELNLEGDYVMDGKFLLIPLKGKGKCKLTLTGVGAIMKLEAEPKVKNGETYWDVKSVSIKINKASNFKVNFENLFNGDKLLGETTNRALNENWEGFWEELKPAMQDTFGEVFRQVANVIHSKVPEKDMFLD